HRRDLAGAVAAGALAHLSGEVGLSSSPAALAVRMPSTWAVTTSNVAVIRQMLAALTASERQFGGGHGWAYARDYLRTVVLPRLHDRVDPRVRDDLFGVATEFTLRVASMFVDAGQPIPARKLLGLAGSLAQE